MIKKYEDATKSEQNSKIGEAATGWEELNEKLWLMLVDKTEGVSYQRINAGGGSARLGSMEWLEVMGWYTKITGKTLAARRS